VLPRFLEFIGDRLLIAHNANFDVSFIRKASSDLGCTFTNPYLDTVTLSRFLNSDLKSHKLDVVAKYYDLGEFNHHRASDDAEMLSEIFFKMLEKMERLGIHSFEDLQRDMSENANPLNIKPYHQVILVKNKAGLKNLYKLISYSYLKYYKRVPRIPRSELEKHREGLIIGSACEAGELFRALLEKKPEDDIRNIVNFYDYLEIQPHNHPEQKAYNVHLAEMSQTYNIPLIAGTDTHSLNAYKAECREILLKAKRKSYGDEDVFDMTYKTYDELVNAFREQDCLPEQLFMNAIENTNVMADSVEDFTLDKFIAEKPFQTYMLDMAKKYLALGDGKWLSYLGASGSGKTHLCSAVAIELIKQGKDVKYMLWKDDSRKIKNNNFEGDGSLIEYYKNVEVLYIDDLFKTGKVEGQVQKATAGDINIAFEIINSRVVQKKITIISSESSIDELFDIDEAVAGRIRQMCGEFCVNISKGDGKNYRKRDFI
jgi:DNA replication protein DnaC